MLEASDSPGTRSAAANCPGLGGSGGRLQEENRHQTEPEQNQIVGRVAAERPQHRERRAISKKTGAHTHSQRRQHRASALPLFALQGVFLVSGKWGPMDPTYGV